MADFLAAYEPLKTFEGGWCDIPGDSGGETYAGIARAVFSDWEGWATVDAAKKHSSFRQGPRAFSAHLGNLPGLSEQVAAWYRSEWWERMGLSRLPQQVANEIFEQSVNLGRGGAGRSLQRLCNALNYNNRSGGKLFDDLAEDGVVGSKTLAALSLLLEHRASEDVFVHALNGLQCAHYISLGAKNFAQRKFVEGWLARTVCPHESRKAFMKNYLLLFLLLAVLAVWNPSLAPAVEADALSGATGPIVDWGGTLLGCLPDSWNGWVTLTVTLCAAVSAVWPRPQDTASPVVRFVYTVVNALGMNAGKARNADDAAARSTNV